MDQGEFDRACRFINALVAVVQRYGVSSSNMEAMLVRVAQALHLRGQFQATPAQVQSVLWDVDEDTQRLHLAVASAGNYDLNKLAQVSELIRGVMTGDITPSAGLERIRMIDRTGLEYGPRLDALAYVLCGVGFGVIVGIPWLDVLLGGVLSLITFGLARLAVGSLALMNALEVVVAAVISALATMLTLMVPSINPLAVTVCACIFFVPGFGLTLGASELVNGNTLSGIIGFTRALVVSLKLVIGATIGATLIRSIFNVPSHELITGVPHLWTWLAAPMLVLGLSILFRVRRKDLVWPLIGGIIVWTGVEVGSTLGFWQGTFIGAFLLMITAQAFTQISRLPSDIILLPVVMLLVPGVAALAAIYAGESEGILAGINATVDVFVLIGAIIGGVMLAETIWSLNEKLINAISSRFSRKKMVE